MTQSFDLDGFSWAYTITVKPRYSANLGELSKCVLY